MTLNDGQTALEGKQYILVKLRDAQQQWWSVWSAYKMRQQRNSVTAWLVSKVVIGNKRGICTTDVGMCGEQRAARVLAGTANT